MSKLRLQALFICLAFGLNAASQDAIAQGKGGGKGKEGGPGQSRGGPPEKAGGGPGKSGKAPKTDNPGRGNSGAARSDNKVSKANRSAAKDVAKANRGNGRKLGAVISSAAIAKASSHGRGNDFRIEDDGDRVRIVNRDGTPLLFISDDDAREMGRWRVGLQDNNVKSGAPSFCRSGAGHPVWGRQWCINKGFGLGDYENYRWGRTTDLGGWAYPRQTYEPSITSAILQTVLGPTAYNRLALHAIEMGFHEPLTGRYVSQPNEPQVLFIDSGRYPVAELRDDDRDFDWDDLLVALLLNR